MGVGVGILAHTLAVHLCEARANTCTSAMYRINIIMAKNLVSSNLEIRILSDGWEQWQWVGARGRWNDFSLLRVTI